MGRHHRLATLAASVTALGFLALATGSASAYTCPSDKFAHVRDAVREAVHWPWTSHDDDKCVSWHHHQFWVKAVKVVHHSDGTYTVNLYNSGKPAQLSHILSYRPDDQYHFSFTVSADGRLTDYRDQIDRGGFTRLLEDAGAQKILSSLSGDLLSDDEIETLIDKWGRKIGKKLDGTWEGTAKAIGLEIAAVVAGDAADAYRKSHPSGATVVRDHRKPPVVRDHRGGGAVVVRDHRDGPVVRDHR